ncbi:4'-phosphopantetheinyl transferase family protein [Chryseobacterium sp. JM1]|uniref:4'-phosphopantetheinyl transferase family protein n=1 Tax=Chryseobacterium sp. JM1 TaxID=1233950 RepID=UPI000AB6F00A|nr:4'-phosphopantetheinyl transferase superfamily protein [Chryseobacterium sp. JM1]
MITEKLALQRVHGLFPATVAIVEDSLTQLKEIRHSFLHEKELIFFDTLKLPEVQKSYLLGRYAAKMALSTFMDDIVPTDVWVGRGIFQQPVLYLAEGGNIQLSISHTTEVAIALIFPEAHPMGVDVEAFKAGQTEAIEGIITPNERKKLPLMEVDMDHGLTVLWTIKEALSKVLKTGLMTPFHLFEIDNIERKEEIMVGSFINFPQYKSVSWISKGHAWSIVLPGKSDLDRAAIKRLFF